MKASILQHFDSERHIHIEINVFNYAVASILFQSDNENQWHSIAFWFRMMINVERNYETYDQKLLIIVAIIIIIINSYTLVTSIRSTHEKLYAICIEWTKLSEIENHSQSTWLLHAVETVSFETMYQICSRWLHVREWVF